MRHASLWKSTTAAAAFEFGLLGPIIVALVLVSLGFARMMEMNTLVYDAALETSRYGSTGSGGTSRLSNITAISAAITGVGATVTMTPYATWSALQSATPNTSEPSLYGNAGSPGEVVVYSISYTDPVAGYLLGLIPMFARGATGLHSTTLTQTMIVQNEPNFSSS